MSRQTKPQQSTSTNSKGLHRWNLHRQGYNFPQLINGYPILASYVGTNAHSNLSIDYGNPLAVKALNAALLSHHYQIADWDIPEGALCPPIPGRADYIYYAAELLGLDAPNGLTASTCRKVTLLDIGTGANGIYSLLASKIYGWHCIASDIDKQSLQNVASIIDKNPTLANLLTLRLQVDKNQIFKGIIAEGEFYDVSVCNPPFHASAEDAHKANQTKLTQLANNRGEQANRAPGGNTQSLNFGGSAAELWCNGGERLFLKKMAKESLVFSQQVRWFSSLVSKTDNLKPTMKLLRKLGTTDIREIEMKQGNKITRILAWTYF